MHRLDQLSQAQALPGKMFTTDHGPYHPDGPYRSIDDIWEAEWRPNAETQHNEL